MVHYMDRVDRGIDEWVETALPAELYLALEECKSAFLLFIFLDNILEPV